MGWGGMGWGHGAALTSFDVDGSAEVNFCLEGLDYYVTNRVKKGNGPA